MSERDDGVSRRGLLRATTAGAAATGLAGAAAGQESGDTVTVDLVDYAYEPGTDEPLRITPGTTVNFVWQTPTHNIAVDSQPEGAEWEGHEPIEGAGFEYSHTFEVVGTYEFHCDPHLNLGMEGTIVVSESAPAEGGYETVLPDSALTLGVATVGGMAAVLGLTYVFLKYGGDHADLPEE